MRFARASELPNCGALPAIQGHLPNRQLVNVPGRKTRGVQRKSVAVAALMIATTAGITSGPLLARDAGTSSVPVSISFPTLDDGYIAESNYLAHTFNAARTWSVIRPGLGTIAQVQFLTPKNGFIVTAQGLFATLDGGTTWKRLGSPRTYFTWMSFATPKKGWGIADGALFRTSNSGATWKRVATPTAVTGACSASALVGWIASAPSPVISETDDGGASWMNRPVPAALERQTGLPPYSVQAFSCNSPTTIWVLIVPAGAGYAGGEAYGVYDSSNGGQSWRLAGVNPGKQHLPAAPSAQPDALHVAGTTAYLAASCGDCGSSGTTTVGVLRSGQTKWRITLLKGVGFAQSVLMAFPSASSGWALTVHQSSGRIQLRLFETRNDGNTWTSRPVFKPT